MVRLLVPLVLLLSVVGISLVTDRPPPRADFTFINRGDVSTLDLQRMSWMQDLRAALFLFEGLTRNDVFTWGYDVTPGVAESWEVSDDRRVYTFHLRADARWSNGQPVRAGDFVFSWRRALLPDTAADYFALFQLLKGATDFYNWRQKALDDFPRGPTGEAAAHALWLQTEQKFDELVAVKAPDDRTLRVELDHPTPYFLDLCAFPVFMPSYPPLVSQYDVVQPDTGRVRCEQGWTKPPVLVGNGPFKMVSWRFKRDMRFVANEFYWNRAALNINTMEIRSVEDRTAQVLAFNAGAVDWVSEVVAGFRADMIADKRRFYDEHRDEVARYRALGLDDFEIDRRLPDDPRAWVHPVHAFGTYWYNFNCKERLADGRPNPFHDPRVQRAFAMAVDKRSIVDQVRRIDEPPASTIIPPGSIQGYESPTGLPFDPDAARRLLADAGYPDPSRFITVDILFNKDGAHDVIAQAVARNWQEYLGVPVSLTQKEIKVFREDLKNANYMVSRAGWWGDYGDPTTFLDVNRTGDGNNDRKYSSAAYDALLKRAETEIDPAARFRILAEAERLLVEVDLPLIPLFHETTTYMFDAHKISGLNPHPRTTQLMGLIDVLGDGKGRDVPLSMPPRPPQSLAAQPTPPGPGSN